MNINVKRKLFKVLIYFFYEGFGIGKIYVSSIIVESIYKKGMWSKYVYFIFGIEFLYN